MLDTLPCNRSVPRCPTHDEKAARDLGIASLPHHSMPLKSGPPSEVRSEGCVESHIVVCLLQASQQLEHVPHEGLSWGNHSAVMSQFAHQRLQLLLYKIFA